MLAVNYKNIQDCYIMLFCMYWSLLPWQNPPTEKGLKQSSVADDVSLFKCRVCPVVDNVSFPDFDYFTAARATIFFFRITIRTSATQVNRVYHEFWYYISLIIAVRIPVEGVIYADWSPKIAVIIVVGSCNTDDTPVKFHSVV